MLDEPAEIVDRPGATDLVDPDGAIELTEVDFAYRNGPSVLRDLAFGWRRARRWRRGADRKRQVHRLPADPRFYDVDDGSLRVDGTDVRSHLAEPPVSCRHRHGRAVPVL